MKCNCNEGGSAGCPMHDPAVKPYNRFKVALDIQDAVNLVALSREFVKVVDAAYEERSGTVSLRDDPAVILFVNKFESMCRSEERFSEAYCECIKLAEAQ